MKNKAYGMMIGLVVGDILGAPVQFGVNSQEIRENIEKLIIADNFNQKTLKILCPRTFISKIVGNRKKNVIYFKQKYDIDIRLEESKQLIILGRQYEWEEFIKL